MKKGSYGMCVFFVIFSFFSVSVSVSFFFSVFLCVFFFYLFHMCDSLSHATAVTHLTLVPTFKFSCFFYLFFVFWILLFIVMLPLFALSVGLTGSSGGSFNGFIWFIFVEALLILHLFAAFPFVFIVFEVIIVDLKRKF